MPVDNANLQAQIDAVTLQIDAVNAAMLTILVNADGTISYEIDTGQGKQKVTRTDPNALDTLWNSLYNRLTTLCARQTGSGVFNGRPGY